MLFVYVYFDVFIIESRPGNWPLAILWRHVYNDQNLAPATLALLLELNNHLPIQWKYAFFQTVNRAAGNVLRPNTAIKTQVPSRSGMSLQPSRTIETQVPSRSRMSLRPSRTPTPSRLEMVPIYPMKMRHASDMPDSRFTSSKWSSCYLPLLAGQGEETWDR